ncbi:sugar ABC transporter ATP-binding protein, partial [Pseudomonas syringae pv. tagetis]
TLPGQPVLLVCGLLAGRFYEVFDLSVRRGEVVGLTVLVGSGAKELLKSLLGLLRPDRGDCLLNVQPLHLNSPRDPVSNGIALVPEDRLTHVVAPA